MSDENMQCSMMEICNLYDIDIENKFDVNCMLICLYMFMYTKEVNMNNYGRLSTRIDHGIVKRRQHRTKLIVQIVI